MFFRNKKDNKGVAGCQIQALGHVSEPLTIVEKIKSRFFRVKRIFRRRVNYIYCWFSEITSSKKVILTSSFESNSAEDDLQAGDLVKVRSKREIQATLNRWNQLKGCSFLEEMYEYCDTNQQVMKPIKQFLDERDYLVKKCKGIVILAGLICEGTKDFGPCDRSCFYFWREEWLEKI